jgi:RNA polymerase sigma-70 factor (ECF subfamily)
VLQNEAVENFRSSLSRLPAICQEAMMLRSFYGLQYQEVAAILDITEGTVKSRIHRGRRELARLLAQQRAS